jgi:CRP/FNR family transcriptional regulator
MRGELRSIRENAHGREQVLSTERRGAVLALAPNFNGGKFYSTVIADELSDVLCIHREDVHRFCHEHQEVLWCVARVMAHRVRHYAELVETLALRNVDQRVADYLLSLAREFGTKTERGLEVELKSTRTEIATQVGSAREVVSRVLHHLQKLGLIQLQEARLIVIPDAKALGAFAGRRGPILGESPEKLSSEIV